MKLFMKIAQYTVIDQMRSKSVTLLLAVSMGLLFLTRGCYSADYVINGLPIDGIGYFSRVLFQAIVLGMLLMVSMISMRVFTRDQTDGSMEMFLSRPVKRWEYVLGRIMGTWLLSSGFMLLLHLTIFFIVWSHRGEVVLGYIGGSMVCSVNLLFIASAVCLFSLFMPGFISALFAIGLIGVGFISDGGHQFLNGQLITVFSPSATESSPALWRILYPKLFMVQAYADALIAQKEFISLGPIHPLINVFSFILLLIFFTLIGFYRKQI
jgi:ABC-type transport system involved in multi-copper enzyme maturation permease subunit